MAWYLEDAARVELASWARPRRPRVHGAGVARSGRDRGRLIERMWEWLTAGDPESSDVESAMAERCAQAGGVWI
jgi:HCOMODA/2-hydroxy-3-carboxy-muconic semialdehyde decarboxylase